jgi:hypothetical protein
VFFRVVLVLFRFVSKQFVSVVLNSIPKQQVLMFQLNRNKQKTNQNSVIESIFRYFTENLGLFGFDSKQFCVLQLFRYRSETPKQSENFSFWFQKTNRNRSCFCSNWIFFSFRGHPTWTSFDYYSLCSVQLFMNNIWRCPKLRIFIARIFFYFYTIKSLWVGDFRAKI